MALIIVESPTKARTFNRILKGKDFFVFATLGHIRDLPSDSLAVDVDNQFKPHYELMKKKERVLNELIELSKQHDTIILATDLDREGESISYHVACILGLIRENWPDFTVETGSSKKLERIVFHEITSRALEEALEKPSTLRVNLIKSQQARRILDRLVGYELSPLLWKKTGKNWLSAGRVQTVALRLIVEREKERTSFRSSPYYHVSVIFLSGKKEIEANLIKIGEIDTKKDEVVNLYAGPYQFQSSTINGDNVSSIETDLKSDSFSVLRTDEDVIKRYPQPPHTTSLLQQDAFYKYGFSSKMVMRLAQDLYERGYITYHRTDSFNLSTQFVFRAKEYIEKVFGKEYSLEKPRGFRNKSRMAQEAHEAIRPTKLLSEKEAIKKTDKKITANHKKLYKLIFERAVATQMKEAEIKVIKLYILSKKKYLFESVFQKVLFDGFLRISQQVSITPVPFTGIKIDTPLQLSRLNINQKDTNPPPRYNDATLIRIMEEKGIGRPSTYAPIISLIQEKGYVEKDGRYFAPTLLGKPLSDYLSKHFPQVFDLSFTSTMEAKLDEVAEGTEQVVTLLQDFFTPFKKQLTENNLSDDKLEIKEETHESCPKCSKPVIVRYSKFGKFYACSGYPECKYTKPFLKTISNAFCPKCKGNIVIKYSKSRKRFYGCSNYPTCNFCSWTVKELLQPTANKT